MDDFEQYRRLLFSVAYRILGSAAEAEDVVQDTWLRWTSDDRDEVREPKAYLVRIATNLALNRLRAASRETYVGPWLPEPILTTPDSADAAELADSVSTAILVVLETLTPLERAVFVLREAFGFPYAEIATAVGRSEESVRQLGHRAREHVRDRRPRFSADRSRKQAATERFMAAAEGGDINSLLDLLAPDVTLWTDGGGKVRAARRPLYGAEKVSAWLLGVVQKAWQGVEPTDVAVRMIELNGAPALLLAAAGRTLGTVELDLDPDGRVAAIYMVANPDKLTRISG